jgi:hypothetical protein
MLVQRCTVHKHRISASRSGLTLDEMAAELEVGRRTAERLRDSLAVMFPQMECWDDNERMRRLRLPESRPGRSRLDEYNRMVDEPRSYALSCGCLWTLLIESELQALTNAPSDVATFIFGFKFAGGVH